MRRAGRLGGWSSSLAGSLGASLTAMAALGACGDPAPEVCRDGRSTVICQKLSSFGLFLGDGSGQEPAEGVVPFEPNSPLFSDYTQKSRFLYLPPGAPATYSADEVFDLPVGAILIKTFAYPKDMRQPALGRRLLETRLLLHKESGWVALPYVWNDAQTDATLRTVGTTVDASWIHTDGAPRTNNYVVPNVNQCKECHEDSRKIVAPIGVKARHLNREHLFPEGKKNQLAYLGDKGLLRGAPAPEAAPRLPVWDDPQSGTVGERARAWLEINCAHCHNPMGGARQSGLDLRYATGLAYEAGLCKTPVAAGKGSGGRSYSIVPGKPDESILVYRIESTTPKEMMPETGRRLPHVEGIALVREWIAGLPGTCE